MPRIENVEIYGLKESFRASKFPMKADTADANDDYTEVIEGLANTPIGSGHDNFLNGIVVQFDLTGSTKFWVQGERYHFFDFVSSQSTMHCISRFGIRKMCNEYVDEIILRRVEDIQQEYLANKTEKNFLRLIYNIPSGFELTARMTTNYRQLKTMYAQRKHHRLPDWKYICHWIESLPYASLITGDKAD